ncbi:DUF2523 family protein [Proteus sp. FZP2095]|uniref:DUF2523 family protein n=1 Tax=Proteus sp. FZP2095 TaxID=2950158 RepID=UPI0020338787|nr:DUF2523 family protein [Proteus sp. FZP2095]MCM2366087.1 DUF2523 domain-containing protein [Proteus sp. FZP2095]MCM2366101.1 DUF2523 domain-containing protein [Proteus sp. FZP2095]
MFKLLLSVFNTSLGFIFRTLIIKFILFFSLYFVVHEFIAVMATWLPKSTNLPQLFSSLPDGVWYFMNLFLIPYGITLLLSALFTRFIIRRIPLIG